MREPGRDRSPVPPWYQWMFVGAIRGVLILLAIEVALGLAAYGAYRLVRRPRGQPVDYLASMATDATGRPTLPCQIGTLTTTCIVDTGSAVGLAIPQGMQVGGQDEPFTEAATGVTGATAQGQVESVTLAMAGQHCSIWAVALPGYSGPPLVGMPGLRALGAIVVVDAPDATAWFVVEQ